MGRAPCCDKNGLKRGPWTAEEDQKLIDYIQKHGSGKWRALPKNAGLQRCGKSCRLRWTNYLRPDIKRGRFSFEEEETIIQLHSVMGNKWSAIAACLPGRTDNEIKNYWNTNIRKRLLRMGIDPVTHSPRLDLLDLSSILSSSQMNLSRLLGVQSLVNPEILRLASSLVSSQRQNQNFILQNGQENQLHQVQNQKQEIVLVPDDQFQSQLAQEVPTTCTSLVTTPCVPFPGEASLIMASLIMDANEEHYPSSISNDFTSQLGLDWQNQTGMASNSIDDYVPLPSYYNSYSYGYDQGTILDPSSESSTFISNNMTSNDSNIGFVSVISTPSSSPTPINSNYINSGSTSTEDDRESYCSNVMKFEIPSDILDGSNFMYRENLN